MLLLETQQVVAVAAQQQPVTGLKGQVGKWGGEAVLAPVQLQHIHVEAPLQAAVVQRLANQLGLLRDQHIGEVTVTGEAAEQVLIALAAVGQQPIGDDQHVQPPAATQGCRWP